MNRSVTVRAASVDDLPFIFALQESSPEAPHWSEEQYREMLTEPAAGLRRVLLLAEVDGAQAAYAAASCLLDEAELEAVVVGQRWRREGIGRGLVQAVATWARVQGAQELRLEVRASNEAAGALYEAVGFRQAGVRPRYYSGPEEDAVLMAMHLGV